MTAIVAGNGLGLFNTSAAQLNGYGVSGQPRMGNATDNTYVNVVNGNLVVQSLDEYLVSLGLDTAVMRTYNSQGKTDPDTNDNWRISYYRSLVFTYSGQVVTGITRTSGDGSVASFAGSNDSFSSHDGTLAADTITRVNDTWKYTEGETGIVEAYDTSGKLLWIEDANHLRTTVTFNASNLITQIQDHSGQTTSLAYNGSKQLTQITLSCLKTSSTSTTQTPQTLIRVRYEYDGLRLIKVYVDLGDATDALRDDGDSAPATKTYVTTYSYDGTSLRVSQIDQSDGTQLKITYAQISLDDWRVSELADGLGRKTFFSYYLAERRTDAKDALGNITSYLYDAKGRLTQVVMPEVAGVRDSVTYKYDANDNVASVTDGLGRKFQYIYDGKDNLIRSYDPLNDTIWRKYGAGNELLVETRFADVDPDGPTIYDSSGNATSGAASPILFKATRYVYDANRNLRFMIGADGRVSEYAYDNKGNRVTAIAYNDPADLYNVAPLGPEDVITLATMVAWASNANRHKDKTNRVEYMYDATGQITLTTRFDAVSPTGVGTGPHKAWTVYDNAGRLLIKIDERGASLGALSYGMPYEKEGVPLVTSYHYEGLSRMWKSVDSIGRITTSTFDDANRRVDITTQDGKLISTSRFDQAGQLLSLSRVANGTTNLGQTYFQYDDAGRLRMQRAGCSNGTPNDPDAQETFYFFDERGRKVGEVNGAGELSEMVYDDNGRVVQVIHYNDRISRSLLVDSSTTTLKFSDVTFAQLRSGSAASTHMVAPSVDFNGAAAGTTQAAVSVARGNAGARIFNTITASAIVDGDAPPSYVRGITVYIANRDDGAQETLQLATGATLSSAITFSSDGRTATFAGYDTVANYVAALKQLTYTNTGTSNHVGPNWNRYVQVYVNDGTTANPTRVLSNVANALVTVTDPTVVPAVHTGEGSAGTLLSGLVSQIEDRPLPGTPPISLPQPDDPLGDWLGTLDQGQQEIGRMRDGFEAWLDRPLTTNTGETAADVAAEELALLGAELNLLLGTLSLQVQGIQTQLLTVAAALPAPLSTMLATQLMKVQELLNPLLAQLTVAAQSGYASLPAAEVRAQLISLQATLVATADPIQAKRLGDPYLPDPNAPKLDLDSNDTGTGARSYVVAASGVHSTPPPLTDVRILSQGSQFLNSATLTIAIKTGNYGPVTSYKPQTGEHLELLEGALEDTNITVSAFDVPTGTLTLSGYDSIANYERVLESLRYVPDGARGSREVQVRVNDGTLDSNTAVLKLVVLSNGQEEPPVSTDPGDLGDASSASSSMSVMSTAYADTASSYNRIENLVYDKAGRLAFKVDEQRYLTQYLYDGRSLLVKEVRFASPVAASAALTETSLLSKSATLSSNPDNRVTRHYYDAEGHEVGTFVALSYDLTALKTTGFFTEHRLDAGGRLMETVAWSKAATKTNIVLDDPATQVAALRPVADPAQDQHSYYLYDASNQQVGWIDPQGYVTECVYDLAGNKTVENRYGGQVTYDVNKPISAYFSEAGSTIRSRIWAYDNASRVTSVTDEEGIVTETMYHADLDVAARTTEGSATDARSRMYRYDGLGRVIASLSGEGVAALDALTAPATQPQIDSVWAAFQTVHAYDEQGRLVRTTDPNQHYTLYYYDRAGRLRYTVRTVDSTFAEVTETQYDAFGAVATTKTYASRISFATLVGGLEGGDDLKTLLQGSSRATVAGYDLRGLRVTSADSGGFTELDTYNAFRQISRRKLESGSVPGERYRTDTTKFDTRGLVIESIEGLAAGNRTTTFAYDAFGRLVSSSDPNLNVRTQAYDQLGRVIQTVGPSGKRRIEYDAFGRQWKVYDGLGHHTEFEYHDGLHELVVTTAEGVVTKTVRNLHGQTASVKIDGKTPTTYEYDADGNLTSVTDPNGTVSGREYDHAGLLTFEIDGNGTKTAYTYDAANRLLTRTVDPEGLALVTGYTYDAFGGVVTLRDAEGIATETVYDSRGKALSVIVDSDDATNPSALKIATTYIHDAFGNQVTVEEGRQATRSGATWTYGAGLKKTAYAYNTFGELTSMTVDMPTGQDDIVTSYMRDAKGNVTVKTDATGKRWHYVYDENDRQVFEVDPEGGVSETVYDAEGRVLQTLRYADAITNTTLTGSAGAITRTQVMNARGALLLTQDFGADLAGFTERDSADNQIRRVATSGGRVSVTAQRIVQPTNNKTTTWYPDMISGDFEVGSGPIVFRSEVDSGAATNGRYLLQAFEQANGAMHGARFSEGELQIATRSGWATVDNLVANTVYVVEIEVTSTSSDVYVYRKGESRGTAKTAHQTAAFTSVHTITQTVAWGTANTSAVTHTVYVDNVSVYRPQYLKVSADQQTRTIYDQDGRPAYSIDRLGSATKYDYDSAGRLTRRTQYWNGITPADLAKLNDQSTIADVVIIGAASRDRITRTAYDDAGRARFAVDPQRYVTENVYDGSGNVIKTVRYSVALDPAVTVTVDTVAAQRANLGEAGAQRYVYDAANRLRFAIDADGGVVETSYDRLGRVTATTRYANALDLAQLPDVPTLGDMLGTTRWSENLNAADYTVPGGLTDTTPTLVSGAVAFHNDYVVHKDGVVKMNADYRSSLIQPGIVRGTAYTIATSGPVGFRAEVNTGPITDRRRLTFTVTNGLSGTSSVRIHAKIDKDALSFIEFHPGLDANNQPVSVSVTKTHTTASDKLKASTIYMVEVEVTTAGADLYFYEKGLTRAEGWVYHQTANWTSARMSITTEENPSYPVGPATVTVDNLLEYKPLITKSAADQRTVYLYDGAGQLGFTVDALGYVTEYGYDAMSRITDVVRYEAAPAAPKRPTLFAVSASLQTLRNGSAYNWTRSLFDAAGKQRFTIDAENFVEETVYDAEGRVTHTYRYDVPQTIADGASVDSLQALVTPLRTSAKTRHTRMIYDGVGRVTSVIDAEGKTESYGYDGAGNRISLTNKLGNLAGNVAADYTWRYDYDAAGRMVEERAPATTFFTNAGASQFSAVKTTKISYNRFGEVASRVEGHKDTAGAFTPVRTTSYEYDLNGLQDKVISNGVSYYDASDNQLVASPTTYTWYDAQGHAIIGRDQNGRFSYKTYDELGRIDYEVDAARCVTRYSYDAFGNATAVQRFASALSVGATITDQEAALQAAADVIPPNPSSERATLATLHEAMFTLLNGLTNTGSRTITTSYDTLNRKTDVMLPAVTFRARGATNGVTASPTTHFEYDAFGDVVKQQQLRDPVAGEWLTSYFAYDHLGRQTRQIDSGGYLTVLEFDAFGDITQRREFASVLTDPANSNFMEPASTGTDRFFFFDYDRMGRRTKEYTGSVEHWSDTGNAVGQADRGFEAEVRSTAYDAVGNIVSTTDEVNTVTRNFYDVLGRLVATTRPARGDATYEPVMTITPLVRYGYDALGNQTIETHYVKGAVSADNPTPLTPGADPSTKHLYDALGRVLYTWDANAHRQDYGYDLAGNLRRVSETVGSRNGNADTSLTKLSVLKYDETGRLTESAELIERPDHVTMWVRDQTVFNAFGEKINRGINGDNAVFAKYDAAGRMWQTNDGGVIKAYEFDLTGAVMTESLVKGSDSALGQAAHVTSAYALGDADDIWTAANLIRTEFERDKLGRVTVVHEPSFTTDGHAASSDESVKLNAGKVTSFDYDDDGCSMAGQSHQNRNDEPVYAAHGSYSLWAKWESLDGYGDGRVTVTVRYKTAHNPGGTTYTKEFANGLDARSGVQLNWTIDKDVYDQAETLNIEEITEISVSKVLADGTTTITDVRTLAGFIGKFEIQLPRAVATSLGAVTIDGQAATLTAPANAPWVRYVEATGPLTAGNHSYDITINQATLQYTGSVDSVPTYGHYAGQYTVAASQLTAVGASSIESQSSAPERKQDVDRWGNVLRTYDPRTPAWVTSYTYNHRNQQTSQTLPVAEAWGENGALVTNPNRTSYTYYDARGLKLGTRNQRGVDITTTTDATQMAKGYFGQSYNLDGQRVRDIAPLTNQTLHFFDAIGREVVTKTDGIAQHRKTYDAMGRLLKDVNETYADKRLDKYGYDELGNRTLAQKGGYAAAENDSLDELYTYDTAGRVIRSLPHEAIDYSGTGWFNTESRWGTRYQYDDRGNKTRETNGLETDGVLDYQSWTYDDFGRVLTYRDFGGKITLYQYDGYGRLIEQKQTNAGGQDLKYSYYENGWLKSVDDVTTGHRSYYEYDKAGNRVLERYVDAQGAAEQDDRLSYDSRGRLARVRGNRYALQYGYDEVGNRRLVSTRFQYRDDGSDASLTSWYKYDAADRMTISQGVLDQGQIKIIGEGWTWMAYTGATPVRQKGVALEYDANGRRKTATSYDSSGYVLTTETYSYDQDSRIVATDVNSLDKRTNVTTSGRANERTFERWGRLVTYKEWDLQAHRLNTEQQYQYQFNHLVQQDNNLYDYWPNGQLRQIKTMSRVSFVTEGGETAPTDGVDINGDLVKDGYDYAGNVRRYTMQTFEADFTYRNQYSYAYAKLGGQYKEASNSGSNLQVWGGGGFNPGTTTTTYDANGQITRVGGTGTTARSFVTDAQGLIHRKVENTSDQFYYYANGRAIGTAGDDPTKQANFDFNYTGVTPANQDGKGYGLTGISAAPAIHTVGTADTLQRLASGYYGDASLWYLIADANGLTGSEELVVGTQLEIPATAGVHNTDATFQPYKPGEIIGDTTAQLKYVPPAGAKCAAFSSILGAIVAIIVTYVFSFLGPAAPVIGAAAGDMVRQATYAIANDNFNWTRALTMGANFGVKDYDYASTAIAAGAAYVTQGVAGPVGEVADNALIGTIAASAAGTAAAQIANIALGRQEQFDWTALAATAVTAGVTHGLAGKTEVPLYRAGAAVTGAVAGQGARILIEGHGHIDWVAVGTDAFGAYLASSLAAKSVPIPASSGVVNNSDEQSSTSPDKTAVYAVADESLSDAPMPDWTYSNSPPPMDTEYLDDVEVTGQRLAPEFDTDDAIMATLNAHLAYVLGGQADARQFDASLRTAAQARQDIMVARRQNVAQQLETNIGQWDDLAAQNAGAGYRGGGIDFSEYDGTPAEVFDFNQSSRELGHRVLEGSFESIHALGDHGRPGTIVDNLQGAGLRLLNEATTFSNMLTPTGWALSLLGIAPQPIPIADERLLGAASMEAALFLLNGIAGLPSSAAFAGRISDSGAALAGKLQFPVEFENAVLSAGGLGGIKTFRGLTIKMSGQRLQALYGETLTGAELTHTSGLQNGVLGEQVVLQTLEQEIGLTFKSLQNRSGHGADGFAISDVENVIYVVESKSSQAGIASAANAGSSPGPAAKLAEWTSKSLGPAPGWGTQNLANQAFAQEIADALRNGYTVRGIQAQVSIPKPGTTGIVKILFNPWG
jgi:YD repeat-containing protein